MDLSQINIEKELQIIFMGTPVFAVPVLEELIKHYRVRAVVTQPDKIRGNDLEPTFSPIKKIAVANNILVLQPDKIKEDFQEILDLEADLIVTCAYGQILPKVLLDQPRLGCINVHASLLPKLRGGAPIHHAIIDGYKKTGISIMYMSPRMDEGDVISQQEVIIEDTDTASTLHDKLQVVATSLLMETLPSIINQTNSRTPQNHSEATYALNISRDDEKIKYNQTVKQVFNQIRGLNSFPGAYTVLDGKILKVWKCYQTDNYPSGFDGQITSVYNDGIGIKVSNGEIVFTEVQLEGKKRMSAIDFVNGYGREKLIGKVLN